MTKSSGSLSAKTYKRLRDLIVAGRLAPGSRLVESEIASRLEVSRTPVRYALQRLEHERLVSVDRGKRALSRVAPLTKEDAQELLYMMGQIEALAGRWCGSLGREARKSLARDLGELNRPLEVLGASADFRRQRLFELDDRFHQTFVKAGAGPRLLAQHRSVKPQAERYLRFYDAIFGRDLQARLMEHAAIVLAIERGNLDEAERAVQENWRNSAKRLATVIDQEGEVGSW